MSWGENLKKRREALGYTLETAEEETKIRKLYLRALENDDFALLPPKVYAVGFVKNYARFLGLNEITLAEQFKELAYGSEINEETIIETAPKTQFPPWLNVKNFFTAAVFLVLAIWLGNQLVSFLSSPQVVEPPPIKPPIAEPQEKEPPAEQQVPADIITVSSKVNLTVIGIQECWLEVITDGENNFIGYIQPGEEITFIGEESVSIKAGNAGGIEVVLNGQNQGVFGGQGEVKKQEFTL